MGELGGGRGRDELRGRGGGRQDMGGDGGGGGRRGPGRGRLGDLQGLGGLAARPGRALGLDRAAGRDLPKVLDRTVALGGVRWDARALESAEKEGGAMEVSPQEGQPHDPQTPNADKNAP